MPVTDVWVLGMVVPPLKLLNKCYRFIEQFR